MMMHSKALTVVFFLALVLFGIFLAGPDPVIRGVALWLMVAIGLTASLAFSWRDMA